MRHRSMVLVTALVFGMVACDSSDDAATTATDAQVTETGGTQETSVEVFSFADDDLCEWVTEEELTGFVTEAFDWNGSAIQTAPDAPDKCEWRLTDVAAGNGFVVAYDATGSEFQGTEAEPVDFAALDVVDFSDHTPVEMDVVAVSGHPNLSDGVVAYDYGFGQYVFWVPPRQEYLGLYFPLIGGASEFWADPSYFMVADQVLRELAWVD